MIEILPIKILTNEDAPIFGTDAILLANLHRLNIPVSSGIVVSPPDLKLKTTLESFDFGSREVFEQSLNLVKKEIAKIPVPENLKSETNNRKRFLLNNQIIESAHLLWMMLLSVWLDEIKNRLWRDGFVSGLTEELESQIVIFFDKIQAFGSAFENGDEVMIDHILGKLEPKDLKKLSELVQVSNKKLFIPHKYEWILENEVKLTKVLPFTQLAIPESPLLIVPKSIQHDNKKKSVVKIYYDLSTSLTVEPEIDGIYIASEKIFDLNKPRNSFEELVFKIMESALAHPNFPVLVKLADMSEGMGKVRGALRLLHQKSLLEPMLEALDFARHKKGLTNIHVVIPFVRSPQELMDIKRELSVKKLMRKTSLQQWLEIAVPENILNLEQYLVTGLDGVILNLDELIAHLNGFDHLEGELLFYKNEVSSLLQFLGNGLKLLHRSKIPFVAVGSLIFNPKVLEFLVSSGVFGVVIEKYEITGARTLLHQTEKKLILRRLN